MDTLTYRSIFSLVITLAVSGSVLAAPVYEVSSPPRSVVDRSRHMIQNGQVDQGRRLLQQELNHDSENFTARLLLGASYLTQDPDAARGHALDVLKAMKRHAAALDLLSASHLVIRRRARETTEHARFASDEIRDYEDLLDADPEWPDVLYRLASQRVALQRLDPQRTDEIDRAVEELTRCITILKKGANAVELSSAYAQLGRAYKHRGDVLLAATSAGKLVKVAYEHALDALDETLTLAPNRGETDRTEEILSESIEIEPNFLSGHLQLGALYVQLDRNPDAQRAFERVLQIPESRAVVIGMVPSKDIFRKRLYYRAASYLAWLYHEEARHQDALVMVEQAKRYQPLDAYLMDILGSIRKTLGNSAPAMRAIQ